MSYGIFKAQVLITDAADRSVAAPPIPRPASTPL
jgi:hypothetical protein